MGAIALDKFLEPFRKIQNVPAEWRPKRRCGDRHENVPAPDESKRTSGGIHCESEETAERIAWVIWLFWV